MSRRGVFNLACLVLFIPAIFSGCAANPSSIQPQINSLSAAGKFKYASKILDGAPAAYGPQNRLLYLLDYGLISHYAGEYGKSIRLFEEAKKAYNDLYTVSVTNQASTWLINDYLAPYRGEDFERVMVNIFQALNFALSGNIEEALVEARNADNTLKLINQQYKTDEKNIFREDAFARLLLGIIYEKEGSSGGINDAHISYKKALAVYENDYQANYFVKTPLVLKENILATAQWMGKEEEDFYRSKFPEIKFQALKERQVKAEVYLICYSGLSPLKHPEEVPIPLPDGFIAKLAFPRYDPRLITPLEEKFEAENTSRQVFETEAELVEDIGAIAQLNLRNRRARVLAKAMLRPAGKYFLEKQGYENIKEEHGENTARAFKYVSNLFNIASEQPDLRSWQTLPAQVYLARLILDPGEYTVTFAGKKLAQTPLAAGEKRIIVLRFAE